MHYFVTLFDSAYLTRGIVLAESLAKHTAVPFILYVLPMDANCREAMLRRKLPQVNVLDLSIFEKAMSLDRVRRERTYQEYCWTCASQLTEFIMCSPGTSNPEDVTYLDADMMFFADAGIIFKEIGTRSIGVIPHRFPAEQKHQEANGRFNVSWVTFKNDPVGRECLSTWAWQCREWCRYGHEPGNRFADQGYLDAWPDKYSPDELCVIEHIGAGAAPWNIGQYRVQGGVAVSLDDLPLIFYHYHGFKEIDNGFELTRYRISESVILHIYRPYIEAYYAAKGKSLNEIRTSLLQRLS